MSFYMEDSKRNPNIFVLLHLTYGDNGVLYRRLDFLRLRARVSVSRDIGKIQNNAGHTIP